MEISKLKKIFGKKKQEVSDVIFRHYRDNLEDRLIKKQDQLMQLQSDLDDRATLIQKREKNLTKYYLVPRLYVNSVIALVVLAVIFLAFLERSRVLRTESIVKTQADNSPSVTEEDIQEAGEECYKRGVKYYEEIGSYPTLSTGESADEMVIGYCINTKGTGF